MMMGNNNNNNNNNKNAQELLMVTRSLCEHLPEALTWAWVFAISVSLVCFVPSPLQSLLRSFYSRGKSLVPPRPPSSSSSPSRFSASRFTVPQSFFTHFYIVGVIVNTSLLLLWIANSYLSTSSAASPSFQLSALSGQLLGAGSSNTPLSGKSVPDLARDTRRAWRTVFLLLLMEMQVVRRLLESLYLTNYRSDAQMHIMGYLVGIVYYVIASLSLCSSEVVELVSTIQGLVERFPKISEIQEIITDVPWWHFGKQLARIGWLPWLGGVVFMWGSIHQYNCHSILASLRSKDRTKRSSDKEYKIPRGDWFEYVSSAHYLAEIVIYSAFIIVSGGRELNVWLLFLWVVANLTVNAVETHKWYLLKFEDYPHSRRIIFPFVF